MSVTDPPNLTLKKYLVIAKATMPIDETGIQILFLAKANSRHQSPTLSAGAQKETIASAPSKCDRLMLPI